MKPFVTGLMVGVALGALAMWALARPAPPPTSDAIVAAQDSAAHLEAALAVAVQATAAAREDAALAKAAQQRTGAVAAVVGQARDRLAARVAVTGDTTLRLAGAGAAGADTTLVVPALVVQVLRADEAALASLRLNTDSLMRYTATLEGVVAADSVALADAARARAAHQVADSLRVAVAQATAAGARRQLWGTRVAAGAAVVLLLLKH